MGCAKTTLLLTNTIAILLAGGLLAGSLYTFLGPLPEEAQSFVALVPDTAFYGFFAISGIILFLALIGCMGALQQNKCLLSVYAVVVFILLIAEAAVAAILLTNYFAYQGSLDAGTTGVNEILSFTKVIEDEAVNFAVVNPKSWFTAQAVLGCCGYNFRTTYSPKIEEKEVTDKFEEFVKNFDQIPDANAYLAYRDPLNSGLNCTLAGEQEIDSIKASGNVTDAKAPSQEQQEAADESPVIGLEAMYFCEESAFARARPYYTAIGATGAAIAAVLFFCLVSSFALLCCVSEDDGGFKSA